MSNDERDIAFALMGICMENLGKSISEIGKSLIELSEILKGMFRMIDSIREQLPKALINN